MAKEVSFGSRTVRSSPMNFKRKDFLTNPSGSLAKGSTDADRCKFLYDKALRFARHKASFLSNLGEGAQRRFQNTQYAFAESLPVACRTTKAPGGHFKIVYPSFPTSAKHGSLGPR